MAEGIIVIDVPEHTSASEASRALNAPGEAYFLVQVLPIASGHRAYLRRYKQPPTERQPVEKGNKDAEAVVAELLEKYPTMGINKIQEALRERGFKKGSKWVTTTKAKILGTGVTPSEG